MRIRLLTITHKTPTWVKAGYEEYSKRMPKFCVLELVEIPAERRGDNIDGERLLRLEGEKMLAKIKPMHRVIALDLKGELWSTETLADEMEKWMQTGRNIDLLIGGPEGLAPACLDKAEVAWSLSPLTFPHFLVRVIVAEQLYRALSLLQKHPYHR